jgi:NAD-dependent SIR2 family protein deacetylase
MSLRALMEDLKPTPLNPAESHNPAAVASLNKAMAARRVASRSTVSGGFTRFLSLLNRRRRLVLGMTTGFDGLEEIQDSSLSHAMLMLHGDNREMRCCGRRCKGVDAEGTAQLDEVMLGARSPTDRSRECDVCYRSRKHDFPEL